MQEAIPYTSQDFAIIAQALVSWIFSLSTYFILVMLSVSAKLWTLYFVHLLSDVACVAGVENEVLQVIRIDGQIVVHSDRDMEIGRASCRERV